MKNYFRLLFGFFVIMAFVAMPQSAHAEDFSLHLEPGVVAPMNQPQSSTYGAGGVLGVKGMFALKPWLSVGPSVSAMYLPRTEDNGQNAGVLWQWGGAVRLQRDRTSNVNGKGLSPWVDLDAMLAHTGDLYRPAFDVGIGAETSLDDNHSAWFGPFIRYTHVFQTSDSEGMMMLDKRDVNMLQAGASFSFDFPTRTHTKVVEHEKVKVVREQPVVVVVAAPAPKPVQDKFELTEHVYFAFDSSTLNWEEKDKLDTVVAKLQKHHDVAVNVQGHASSDGQKVHNLKLAAARAASVQKYLTDHGVDASRLTVVNLGIDHPAASDKTNEGRQRNRRVDFEVTITSVQK